MNAPPERPTPETLNLLYDEAAEELRRQEEQITILDGRAQQLLGFAGVILGLVITLHTPPNRVSTILFGVGVAIFFAVGWHGLKAWKTTPWRSDPAIGGLWEKHRLESAEFVRHQVILNRLEAIKTNQNGIDVKLDHLAVTQALLAIEVLYLSVVVLLGPYAGD